MRSVRTAQVPREKGASIPSLLRYETPCSVQKCLTDTIQCLKCLLTKGAPLNGAPSDGRRPPRCWRPRRRAASRSVRRRDAGEPGPRAGQSARRPGMTPSGSMERASCGLDGRLSTSLSGNVNPVGQLLQVVFFHTLHFESVTFAISGPRSTRDKPW